MPRYQDRRVCKRCGSLVERWCSHDPETDRIISHPTLVPTSWFEGDGFGKVRRLDPIDVQTQTVEVEKKGYTTTEEVRRVRIDYFCATCDQDVLTSNTRPIVGDLPEFAFYEVGATV